MDNQIEERNNFILQIILKILMMQGFYFLHAIIFRISLILLAFKQQGIFSQIIKQQISILFLVTGIYNLCLSLKIIVLFIRTLQIQLDDIVFGITHFLRNKNPNYHIFEFDCLDFLLWQKNISSKLNKFYWLNFLYSNIVVIIYFKQFDFNTYSHRLLISMTFSSYIYLIIIIVVKFSNIIQIPKISNIQDKLQLHRVSEIIQNIITNVHRNSNNQKVCMICLQEIQQMIVILPCNEYHYFHEKCIKSWLRNKISCPLCRINLRKYYIELK